MVWLDDMAAKIKCHHTQPHLKSSITVYICIDEGITFSYLRQIFSC